MLVYNNYPWPPEPTEKQKHAVERASQAVLAARAAFKDQTLADLYNPLAMPKSLLDTHRDLDRSVDRCYRSSPFDSDRQRVEYLFGLYENLTSLYPSQKKRKRR
ncbi:MAG TPA: type IIL restriction-modification enzyme MmeI [Tepidisphaeraceae bacterium]|nr:type IIL restriction-modification enzyme MmeI [Tepidisphaeraceae bacterium]